MDVTKSLSRLRDSLTTLDVGKLVVGQIEADHGHDLLYTPLVLFLHLGSAFEGGASSDSSIMSQRSMEVKSISILNFQRLNLSP
jgi:hypothetical protein